MNIFYLDEKCAPGFAVLKRIEAAAIAAAVSPASSEPGLEVVIANAGRAMVISSGRPQEEWSTLPSPTCENLLIYKTSITLTDIYCPRV